MSFLRLSLLSTLMLISTLLSSFSPLYFHFTPQTLQHLSTYSTGLLVGASLTVVIPEGVEAVYSTRKGTEDDDEESSMSGWIGTSLLSGFILMYMIDSIHGHDDENENPPASSHRHHHNRRRTRAQLRHMPSRLSELEPLSSGGNQEGGRDDRVVTKGDSVWTGIDMRDHHEEDSSEMGKGSIYRDDSMDETRGGGGGRYITEEPETTSQDLSSSPHRRHWNDEDEPHDDSDERWWSTKGSPSTSALSTVIGLLAHSLADGISLGASSLSSSSSHSHSEHQHEGSSSLSTIVFLAIMLHKAPTAFALSNLLSRSTSSSASSSSNSNSFIRRSLVLFSLSAPLGAISTYLLLSLFGSGGGEGLKWYTGMVLVFSGGTFLFVATHAVKDHDESDHDDSDEGIEGGTRNKQQGSLKRFKKLSLVLAGMVTPGLLSRVVGHGH